MLREAQLSELFAYLRFATISADPTSAPEMQACASWLAAKFERLGFEVIVHPCPGPSVVLARRSARSSTAKTLLVYGHYDVQPVDPLASWRHPPFEPIESAGLIYARGATDNKGQTFAHILGTENWLSDHDELPVNLIYLIEGEEEIGSPNLESFLHEHVNELACDGILISDTSMIAPGHPAITSGLRGIACVDLQVNGPQIDLHSGVFGGIVANPATELARLLAALHFPSGRIAIPGFYDAVVAVSPEQIRAWRALPEPTAELLRATGAKALAGEEDFTPLERLWIRPTAEVNGITAGYQGPGSKTIIPASATAKISFRLVPNQRPQEIFQQARDFFRLLASPGVDVHLTYDHGGEPFLAESDDPLTVAAAEALQEIFGREPARVREGLSIPIVALFKTILGRDPVMVGFGLPDCAAHSPNESFPLANLEAGIAVHQALLRRFGS